MLGPQNSALRADITDFYFDKRTDFAKKQGLLVKKSKKIDTKASELRAEC